MISCYLKVSATIQTAQRKVSEISGVKLRNISQCWQGQKIPQTVGEINVTIGHPQYCYWTLLTNLSALPHVGME